MNNVAFSYGIIIPASEFEKFSGIDPDDYLESVVNGLGFEHLEVLIQHGYDEDSRYEAQSAIIQQKTIMRINEYHTVKSVDRNKVIESVDHPTAEQLEKVSLWLSHKGIDHESGFCLVGWDD